MPLKTKKVTEIYDMSVYTDEGTFFGTVDEAQIKDNKISGWRIKATKNSFLSKILGGAKGVIVPHHYVKSIDNIMIISRTAVPAYEASEGKEMEE